MSEPRFDDAPREPEPKPRWTLVDRAVAWASPRLGIRRRAARAAELALRSYEAATRGRRTSGWKSSHSSANEETFTSLARLRDRHRQLVRDNEWAAKAIGIWEEEIGAQSINPQTQDAEDLMPLWTEFADGALDSEGIETFETLQNLVVRSAVEGGDAILRRRMRRMNENGKPERDLPVPLQLELLEGDHLDHEKDRRLDRNRPIAQGVEFDALGRRLAYWLHREHPGSGMFDFSRSPRRVRAQDVHHVFRRERIGQVRGVPWGASAMLTLRDLDDFADASLHRAKLANCFVAFIEDAEAGMSQASAESWTAEQDPPDTLRPGAMEVLPAGRRVTFADPPKPAGYQEVTSVGLHQVATGYQVPHSRLAADYREVNFTSGRLEEIGFERAVRKNRARIARPLCSRIWAWFVEAAILSGRAPRKELSDFRVTWDPPRRELTDPSRMAPALSRLVRMGHNSLSELIRETGRKPDDVFEEIRQEREKLEKMGVVIPELGIGTPPPDAGSGGS